MTDEELDAFEDGRDFHTDLLQSIHEMNAGFGTVVYSQAALQDGVSHMIQSRNEAG